MKDYDFKAELNGDDWNERRLLFKELAVLIFLALFIAVRRLAM
ncbi:MAG TPA: hypothetical protein PKC13_05985 [Blastocatellia bacterium]|nr:hypothetical protein [Blastocatellia bacterium]HMX25161.1 hypothetical protein [Blastocatellia bacterium]HMY71864.1 hypothetical protein [Blastocatellia bacterium]